MKLKVNPDPICNINQSAICLRGIFVFIVAVLLVATSCRNHSNLQSSVKEGVVEFDIEYVKKAGKNIPLQFLPKTMEMKFNEHFASYSIEDRLGLFAISNLIDLDKMCHTTLVKVFDKKYVYQGTDTETSILFNSEAPYSINLLSDTMRLAGFVCKKAEATNSSTGKKFDIYYSQNSEMRNQNKNTPYRAIDGLLLQFSLQLKNIDMNLKARNFAPQSVSDSIFQIPSDYKKISKRQMEEIVLSILP